jgi:hypothetical protein
VSHARDGRKVDPPSLASALIFLLRTLHSDTVLPLCSFLPPTFLCSEYLHLPAEVVPATLHRKERVPAAAGSTRPAGDRPPRGGAGRGGFGAGGDRSEYRRGKLQTRQMQWTT